MSVISAVRRRNLIVTGIYFAASLRANSRNRGIPRLEDFLNGLITGSVLVSNTTNGYANLADTFLCEQIYLEDALASRTFREVKSEIAQHVIGEAIGDVESQRAGVAASVFLLAPEIASDFGATPEDLLRILAFAIIVTSTIHFSEESAAVTQERALDLIHAAERQNPKGCEANLSSLRSLV